MYTYKNGQKVKENWVKPQANSPKPKSKTKEKKAAKILLVILLVLLVGLGCWHLYKKRSDMSAGVPAAFGRKFGFRFF
jgi:hypothetical protein